MAVRIGVLALQGAFAEHERALAQCGAQVCEIRARRDLMGIQGLVLPGGESTVMGTLLQEEGLLIPLRDLCRGGMPVLATCAGMILLAADLPDFALQPRLGVLDISVRRNAFGRQQESFTTFLQVRTFCASAADRVEAVFIRAPLVERAGAGVEVLACLDGHPVAVLGGSMLALSFHPELTEDLRFHAWLVRRAAVWARAPRQSEK